MFRLFANTTSVLIVGVFAIDAPFKGGIYVPSSNLFLSLPTANGPAFGGWLLQGEWPLGIPSGAATYYQVWSVDPGGPKGFSATNALEGETP